MKVQPNPKQTYLHAYYLSIMNHVIKEKFIRLFSMILHSLMTIKIIYIPFWII